MRVFHINDKLEVAGGVEVYIRDVLPELRARGIEVDWIAMRRGDGSLVELRAQNADWAWHGPISELSRSPLAAVIDSGTLFHVHSLSEPQILNALFTLAPVVRHIHEPRMVCPGQGKFWAKSETICTKPYGLHCLYHAYTQQCCNRHPKRLLRQYENTRFEVSRAADRYAALIANSQYIKDEALAVGYPLERLHVLPYFTDVTPEPDWDAPQDPVIVFAGRLSRTKGVHVLLDAFATVIQELPMARLEILGSGHDEQTFVRQAEFLGLGDAVVFLGWADKTMIDAHLSRAAVVAFPSIYPEAFGITGIEAMIRGKPVVAFDVGGVSDWLQNGSTGIALEVGDTTGFAGALHDLLGDDARRKSMGRAARRKALDKFTADVHLARLMQIYEDAIGARRCGVEGVDHSAMKAVD